MCIAQEGQVALSVWLSWCHAAPSRRPTRNCVSAAVTSGSWVSLNSDQTLLQRADALLLEAMNADGETAFLDLTEASARIQAPSKALLERGLRSVEHKGGGWLGAWCGHDS